MEKHITDECTGLKYELVGDYYLIAGDEEPEEHPIGIWGQRHLRHLKQNRKTVYADLLKNGKLNDYLADLNEQAEDTLISLSICGPDLPPNGLQIRIANAVQVICAVGVFTGCPIGHIRHTGCIDKGQVFIGQFLCSLAFCF